MSIRLGSVLCALRGAPEGEGPHLVGIFGAAAQPVIVGFGTDPPCEGTGLVLMLGASIEVSFRDAGVKGYCR